MSDYYDDNNDNLVLELSRAVAELKQKNKKLQEELDAREKLPVPKTIVQQIVEMEAIIRKQQADIEYYKKYVPVQIIINKQNKEKPTRKGGLK